MFLALSLIGALLARPAHAADCQQEYSRMLHEPVAAEAAAPKLLATIATTADAQAGFDLAQKSWRDSFKLETLRKKLIRVTQDPGASEDHREYFIKVINKGSQLISAYLAFGVSRAAPPELKALRYSLDYLASLTGRKASLRERQRMAQKAETALGNFNKLIDENTFKPASPQELKRRMQKRLAHIENVLNKNNLPTPEKLGEVVEDVNELVTLSRAQQALHPSPESAAAYRYIAHLHDELQQLYKGLWEQAQHGDIDYQRQRFFLNPKIRAQLEELKGVVQRTLKS